MKKILLFIILLIIPFYVYADDSCSQDAIQIESITLEETNGNIEETSTPTNDNNSVNLGLKMNVLDDNATYKVVIKNTSDKDYTFDKSTLATNYLNYEITYDDNSDIVKAGETKTIYLNVSYSNRPTTNLNNGVLTDNPKVAFNLSKEGEIETIVEGLVNAIENPNTGDKVLAYVEILIVSLVLLLILFRKYRKIKYTTMLIITIILTTHIVNAICTCPLNIDVNLEVDAKEAIFLPGIEFNIKLKRLAGDDTTTSDPEEKFIDQNIIAFKYSNTEPTAENKEDKNIFSTPESELPIYLWYDNGTVYWWSEDKTPAFNENALAMFYWIENLKDISGLETMDTSKATNIGGLLEFTSIENTDPLANWNISNVTEMGTVFRYCEHLTDLTGLQKWDVSKAVNFVELFRDTPLVSLEGLENWDTSNVKDMGGLFLYDESLKDLSAIKDWDTSSVENIYAMFYDCQELESIEAIKDWNTSNVTNMNWTFSNVPKLLDLSPIAEWNTSKVEMMDYTFSYNDYLTNLTPISEWDVSNVKEMIGLFEGDKALTNVDALSEWEVDSVIEMYFMFRECSSLTNIDGLSGWNTSSLEDIYYIFYQADLRNLDALAGWDISKVEYISGAFFSNKHLSDISGIANWDVKKVQHMDNIFSYDYSLTTIDLSNWETPSLINMSSAFDDCTHVTSILLTKFDTSNVLDMSYAFNQLDSLQELDISNFDTRKVKSFKRMFNNSTNLRHIYIGENWDTSANEDEAIYVFPQTSYLPNFDVNDSTRQNISHAHTGDGGYLELKTNN